MIGERFVAYDARRREASRLAQTHEITAKGSPVDGWDLAAYLDQYRAVGFFRSTSTFAKVSGQPVRIEMISFADVRPREPIMLYRCCKPGRETRPSWTPSLTMALEFAPGGLQGHFHDEAHLFTVVAPPDAILAILHSEYILDVTELTVTDHGTIESYRDDLRPLVDVVEDFPHLRDLIAIHGPNMPVAFAPTARYYLAADDETEPSGGPGAPPPPLPTQRPPRG